jgi:hypothetical protein
MSVSAAISRGDWTKAALHCIGHGIPQQRNVRPRSSVQKLRYHKCLGVSMKLRSFILLLTVALVGLSTAALAQYELLGRWRDNAPGSDPIGILTIARDHISVGRTVTYQVKPVGTFGEGELFAVTGLDRKQDPEGCGPDSKIHYLAVQQLPPIAPGIGGPAIGVFFYSGRSPPSVTSIGEDIALCSIHPFSR